MKPFVATVNPKDWGAVIALIVIAVPWCIGAFDILQWLFD